MHTTRPVPRASLAVLAVAAVLGGCAGASRMANMWKDPSHPRTPIDNVLVVSISKNETWRRVWEDAVVAELKDNGANATPSYSLFPTAVPDTQQVLDAVRDNGYGGVIATYRLDARAMTRYVPGYVTSVPVRYYRYWGDYYHPYYTTIYRPGYVVTDQEVRYQIDVWSAEDGGKLVWMGTTSTVNASSYDQIRSEVSDLLVKELRVKGVIVGEGL